MRCISSLILILTVSFTPAFGANGDTSGSSINEDAVTEMKYDRGFLLEKRDSFIETSGDLPVKSITISGLKKTNPSIVLAETGINDGDPLSSFDPHKFINRLKEKNIFSEIEINYTRDTKSVLIEITVEEKWTLIPIPLVAANRHSTVYGLYIMESNFMGYGKYLFTGGTYSSGSGTAMIGYIDPSIAGSRFRSGLFISYKNEIYQHGDVDYDIYREYRGEKETARLDLGYNLTDSLTFFMSGGYEQGIADHGYNKSLDIPDDQKSWTAGAVAKYDSVLFYEYLCYGPRFEIYSFRHIPTAEKYSGYTTSGYKFDYSFRFIGYNRLSLSSHGSAGNRPAIFEEMIGGKAGGRTLPADIIAADNYINYTITYEYPFLRYRWGAITLLAFWEHGGFKTEGDGMQEYYGPGAGTMVYLKRLALPAMGFNVANNLKTGTTEFSASVGMSI